MILKLILNRKTHILDYVYCLKVQTHNNSRLTILLATTIFAWCIPCVLYGFEYENTLKPDFTIQKINYSILKNHFIAESNTDFYLIPDTAYYVLPDSAKIIDSNIGKYFLKCGIINESQNGFCLVFSKHYKVNVWSYDSTQKNYTQISLSPKPFFFMYSFFSNEQIIEIPSTRRNIQLYVEIKCKLPVGLGFLAQSYQYTNNKHQVNMLIQGLFSGIMLAGIVFACLLLIRLQDWVYFYYLLYLICILFYANTVWKNVNIFYFIFSLGEFFPETIPFGGITIFLLLYVKAFSNTKQHFPVLDVIINCAIGLKISSMLVGIIINEPLLLHPIIDTTLLFPGLVVNFINSRKYNHYRYNLSSFICIYLGMVYQTFNGRLFYMPLHGDKTSIINLLEWDYGFYFLGLVEAGFFAVGIIEKIISVRKQKEIEQKKIIDLQKASLEKEIENQQLKENLNKELEKQVKEKTEQLRKANEILELQSLEIKRVNTILANENLQLNQNIEFLKKARLMDANVSFEEFQLSFSNEMICLKFLEALKWSVEFHCKKCNYNN